MRDSLLRALALTGAAVALLTETLSPFHLLWRGPLAAAWIVILLAVGAYLSRHRPHWPRFAFRSWEGAIVAVIAGICGIAGLTALLSPPNSADAMAYHMPRVVYWAQAGSVAFFPTPYFNQTMLQPLAEYFMLHSYILTGGDHFINLIAFAAFLGSVIGVSALAGALGLGNRGQAFAALFCATLPNGILQASGAKNDWMLTLWLIAMVYFAVRRDAPFTGLCAGLALATKATAYLFAPPMLAAALLLARALGGAGDSPAQPPYGPILRRRLALWMALGILAINGPQYVRNIRLSGLPLGYDSAQGDGFFRWRNEHPGWKSTVSNALRNASEQLGARSDGWNQSVYITVVRIHRALGIDPQDPDTTWRWTSYAPPVNARNHEANAANKWHLFLLALALLYAVGARRWTWALYGGAIAAAFLLFCFYLKWQPNLPRLELALFALGAPLAAFALERLRPAALALLVCLFLANGARPPLFENWTHPLHGPRNIFKTSRDDQYFADMGQWSNHAWYVEAVDRTARSGCANVGIDIAAYQLEYPFQALLRERNASVHFVHTGVTNASARYYRAPPRPCAVLCMECLANQEKIALYSPIGPPVAIGHFLLFLAPKVLL